MTPLLHELVGLPSAASPAEMDRASEELFQAVLDRAARGDAGAQRELVALKIAYLNWAYADPRLPSGAASSNASPAMPQLWS